MFSVFTTKQQQQQHRQQLQQQTSADIRAREVILTTVLLAVASCFGQYTVDNQSSLNPPISTHRQCVVEGRRVSNNSRQHTQCCAMKTRTRAVRLEAGKRRG